jgi:uroporphyrinogen-III synthase
VSNSNQQSYPLQGQTILITRAASANSKFQQILEEKGATVLEMPALVIKAPSIWEPLDRAIKELDIFDWLILTSANGVEYFFQRLTELGKNKEHLQHLKIAVVGQKTAQSLRQYQVSPDFIPPDFIADSLVSNFPESLPGKKILFPRVESGGREVLVQELSEQGAIVEEVAAYQSTCPEQIDATIYSALLQGSINIITFASSKTVKNFCTLIHKALVNDSRQSFDALLKDIKIASIGPQTSVTCQELLQRVDIEAQEYTLEGLTNAIVETVLRKN